MDILSDVDQSTSVINSKDEEGWAPLHSAASIGNVQIVEILLRKGKYVCEFRNVLMSLKTI